MAMELQQHMIAYIRPSIAKHVMIDDLVPYGTPGCCVNFSLLVQLFCDTHWDEETGTDGYNLLSVLANGSNEPDLIERIARKAEEYAATTNGGHEFYLDGFTSVAWCTEDEMLAWNG